MVSSYLRQLFHHVNKEKKHRYVSQALHKAENLLVDCGNIASVQLTVFRLCVTTPTKFREKTFRTQNSCASLCLSLTANGASLHVSVACFA